MQEILELLSNMKPGVDFAEQTNMIEDGVLTSMDVLMLVSALEEEFDVEIGLKEVIPANFCSAEAIFNLVQRLQDED